MRVLEIRHTDTLYLLTISTKVWYKPIRHIAQFTEPTRTDTAILAMLLIEKYAPVKVVYHAQ